MVRRSPGGPALTGTSAGLGRARASSELPPACHSGHLLSGNVERFRGGLAFKAHRLVYHSTLDSRVIKKKKKKLRQVKVVHGRRLEPPLPAIQDEYSAEIWSGSEEGSCLRWLYHSTLDSRFN